MRIIRTLRIIRKLCRKEPQVPARPLTAAEVAARRHEELMWREEIDAAVASTGD